MKNLILFTISFFCTVAFAAPLALKKHSFEHVLSIYQKFSETAAIEQTYSAAELASLKTAGYEIHGFKAPTPTVVSADDQRLEFSLGSRSYKMQFHEDGTASVNGRKIDVSSYPQPVERLKYVERSLRASISLGPWWLFGSAAWAEGVSSALLVERLVSAWEKESKKWASTQFLDKHIDGGVAALDDTTKASISQLFRAKNLDGIDVDCHSNLDNVYSSSVKEEGVNWICSGQETKIVNQTLQPRTVTLYHSDGSLTQITVGIQHPASLCSMATTGAAPAVGSIVSVDSKGKVSPERVVRFKGADSSRLQSNSTSSSDERMAAAVFECCRGAGTKDGSCFDRMVTAIEKSKLASPGTARATLRGTAADGVK